jgi:hypothetical protein
MKGAATKNRGVERRRGFVSVPLTVAELGRNVDLFMLHPRCVYPRKRPRLVSKCTKAALAATKAGGAQRWAFLVHRHGLLAVEAFNAPP